MRLQTDFDDRDLTWHLQVHRDYDDAFLCLESLRRVYPTSRVVLVSDGDDDARWPQLAERFNIEYSLGAHFFDTSSGGKMIARLLQNALAKPNHYILCIDTDTRIHRRFRFLPTGNVVFGTLEHRTEVLHAPLKPPNVQGGFVGLTREAAQKIHDSGFLESAELHDWNAIYGDIPDAMLFNDRKNIISDFQMRFVCQHVGIAPFDFSEVKSQFLFPPEIGDFAVTHPHKTQPRVFPKSQVRAIKRLRFKLKIKRLLGK